ISSASSSTSSGASTWDDLDCEVARRGFAKMLRERRIERRHGRKSPELIVHNETLNLSALAESRRTGCQISLNAQRLGLVRFVAIAAVFQTALRAREQPALGKSSRFMSIGPPIEPCYAGLRMNLVKLKRPARTLLIALAFSSLYVACLDDSNNPSSTS